MCIWQRLQVLEAVASLGFELNLSKDDKHERVLFNVIACKRCFAPFPNSHRAEDLQEFEVNALIVLRIALAMSVFVQLLNYLRWNERNSGSVCRTCAPEVIDGIILSTAGTAMNRRLGRNKTRDQRPGSGTKIRDQILSAEYCCQTCMYRAEIWIKCRL